MTLQPTSDRNRDSADSFARMMRLGQAYYAQGARKQAHRYWRRAALIEPNNEAVWVALLKVVETPDDRRACLENILAINPHNTEAQKSLGVIDPSPQESPLGVVLRVMGAVVFGVLLAVAIVVVRVVSGG